MNRREFLHYSLGGVALSALSFAGLRLDPRFKAIQITSGRSQHWFGYYDKWQIDKNGRYALGGKVNLFYRSPTMKDELKVGLIDLEHGHKWKTIGLSRTWGWQQGCMMQWLPGLQQRVIWNDFVDGRYISKLYDLETGKLKTIPRPVYTLSPDGKTALSIDFDRLQFFRPGYGYPARSSIDYAAAPADQGIYRIDLESGESHMIISYAQIAKLDFPSDDLSKNFHWFNHLLVNPSGDRFIFLNRSRLKASKTEMAAYLKAHPEKRRTGFSSSYITRAITASMDGSDIYPLNDSGQFSHFIWKGTNTICAWANTEDGGPAAFYEFPDKTKEYKKIGADAMPVNGHNTYVPNTNYEWILNDTYSGKEDRKQTLYLYHVPTGKKVILGRFYEPAKFKGEWRCDLHPRCDQQGKRVFFDSTHIGSKRQMYMIDISGVIG